MRSHQFLLLLAMLAACVNPSFAAIEKRPPNIIVLFADDLGYGDLGSYGNPYIRTPNLDELARQGQRWTDFYVPSPVCSPSRGSLMTGKVSVRTGLYGRVLPVMHPGETQGIPASETTMAELLRDAGYATGMFGKWHLGDAAEHWPSRNGFDTWLGMPYSNDMDRVGAPSMTEVLTMVARGEGAKAFASFGRTVEMFHDPELQSQWWNVPLINSVRTESGFDDSIVQQPVDQTTITRRLTEATIGFIRNNADQPFFAYLPYSMPHLPVFSSQDFKGSSLRGAYGDAVEELDWSVGEIRRVIEELGLENDTLVLFTSDNGPWQHAGSGFKISTELAGTAGPLRGAKTTTWEGGVRVPAIFWGPGLVTPATVSEIGSTLDMLATVASLANINTPPTTDGIDLGGVLKRGEGKGREGLPYFSKGQLNAYRQGVYKIHLRDPNTHAPLDTPMLFDLHQDISEQHDIAALKPELLAAMLAAARAYEASIVVAPSIFDKRFIDIQNKVKQ